MVRSCNAPAIWDAPGEPMTTGRDVRLHLVVLAAAAIAATAPVMAAQKGMTYESLRELPDFAGSWTPLSPPFVLSPVQAQAQPAAAPAGPNASIDSVCAGIRVPKEIRPEATAACRADVQRRLSTRAGDRGYCEKRAFTGQPSAGAGGSIEVLLTPGQVTIFAVDRKSVV